MLIFSIGAGVDEIEGDGEGECWPGGVIEVGADCGVRMVIIKKYAPNIAPAIDSPIKIPISKLPF